MRVAPAATPDATPPPALQLAAVRCFGDRLDVAIRYAHLLMTDGVQRGLLGPRESSRIWDRHLLNCAVVGDLVPMGARLVDVGSGAGLPGVVLAVARPDLSVVLVEPLSRRVTFLTEVVVALGLDHATVVRARAEECVPRRGTRRAGAAGHGQRVEPAAVVTARAVASLDRLAAWCMPLVSAGGRLLALKGESVAEEIRQHRGAIARAGGGEPVIHHCGADVLEPPTTVVEIARR